MRIVGGRLRGRALAGPTSDRVRPTSDRLRETIFNVLAHAYGDPVAGARVLDLFAGGGAFALFVDDSAEARGLIRQNIEALGLGGETRLFRRDATRMGKAEPNAPFSLTFCDPPYGKDLARRALASCAEGGWLAPGALVVVEEAQGVEVALPEGFTQLERRDYGETKIVFGRYEGQG